ncbi:MAG: hypothetical protein IJJ34_04475 [Clostridia bacterium]|nr:hypothetical protein [Clostridia bacterium]
MEQNKNRKDKKRNIASLVFAAVALVMFFPYGKLVWTIAFFGAALAGALMAAAALYVRNIDEENKKQKLCHVLSTAAFIVTLITFIAAAVGLAATGILACSIYLS